MSKYTGVSYCADNEWDRRWKAEIVMPNKVKKVIGYYPDERMAALQYDFYAAKFGKPTNILKKC